MRPKAINQSKLVAFGYNGPKSCLKSKFPSVSDFGVAWILVFWYQTFTVPHFTGDAEILVADANTGQIEKVYHVNHKIRKLVSIGRRFCIILLPYVEATFKNVVVLDLNDSKIIGGCTVPHSR